MTAVSYVRHVFGHMIFGLLCCASLSGTDVQGWCIIVIIIIIIIINLTNFALLNFLLLYFDFFTSFLTNQAISSASIRNQIYETEFLIVW